MAQPVKWPDGARCAIMMTFDLDGETPWIHRDPALAERPLHMSMGAYGPKTGMPRILDVLDRYGIKTCIFIPGWIVERYPALCEDIVRRGHEVGHHGYLHEKPFFLKDRDEEEELLVKSLDIFKKILGAKPLGSRSPSADPSPHTMELLKKHGFVYHSNALDTDLPYCHETKEGPLVEFPTAWCNNDAPFFLFSSVPPVGNGIWSQEDVWEIWSEEFEGMYAEGGFFNWLGHPQVVGRPSRMRMVERLIQRILSKTDAGGKKDVWWPRPIDIARFWLEKSPGPAAP
jgi:peptidoglycan-N-acetylglucosamine deacetylase